LNLNGRILAIKEGDITKQDTDAIVNAANSSLMGGGGVDGAIHRAAGRALVEECRIIRKTQYPAGLPPGEAVITSGGRLKAKFVIHTVGPIWMGGKKDESEILKKAYRNSLIVAEKSGIGTISFPSISTGAYGFPIEKAAPVAVSTIAEFLLKEARSVEKVYILAFTSSDFAVYRRELKLYGESFNGSKTPK